MFTFNILFQINRANLNNRIFKISCKLNLKSKVSFFGYEIKLVSSYNCSYIEINRHILSSRARINKEKKKKVHKLRAQYERRLSKRSGPFNHRANEASTGIGRKRHSKDACRVSATTWTHINSTHNVYLVACFPWRNKACPFLLISSHVTAYACQIPWMLENRRGPGENGRKRDKWRNTAIYSRRFETRPVLTWDWGYVKSLEIFSSEVVFKIINIYFVI